MGWLGNHNDGKERVIVALAITLGISALVGLLGSSWTEPNFATYASVAAFASVPHIVLAARTRKGKRIVFKAFKKKRRRLEQP